VTVRFWAVAGALEGVAAPLVVVAGAEDEVDAAGFTEPVVDVVRADGDDVVEAVDGWLGPEEQAARMHDPTIAAPTPVTLRMGPPPDRRWWCTTLATSIGQPLVGRGAVAAGPAALSCT